MKSNVIALVKGTEKEPKRSPRSGASDKAIGRALRLERQEKGRTMEWVAQKLGITYQQYGKMEHGENRVSVSRFVAISRLLGFDAGNFLRDLGAGASESAQPDGLSINGVFMTHLSVAGAQKLLGYYNDMTPDERRAFLSIARSMARDFDQE